MSSTKSFTNELVKRQQSKKRLNEDIQRFLENKKQTRRNVMRNHAEGHQRIYDQYFAPGEGMYSEETFRRRFRMKRSLFQRIMNDVQGNDAYFEQKKDCTGKLGLSALQKVVAALRQLTYGVPADSLDEYIQIGESTALECLLHFCSAVVEVHGQEYLREPNEEDTKRLLEENARRGFPGMLGSLDCMHWEWKNCPTAWHGQYKGKEKTPTLVLEAVASQDTWIWHAFFGMPGSLNDINVLDRSYLFSSLAEGARPAINYSVNGNNYEMGYYLVDGIYPSYATLIKSISHPYTEKQKVSDIILLFGIINCDCRNLLKDKSPFERMLNVPSVSFKADLRSLEVLQECGARKISN